MRDEGDIKKYPALRSDLKISKQTQSGKVGYVVKDPMKDKFYRFDDSEWEIISMFNGHQTCEEIVEKFNHLHRYDEIDLAVVTEYQDSLNSMELLEKSRKEHNIMLIEKMKEMRNSQLLSKKGSILYKRFPVVDPDRFFNKIIHKIGFFWSRGFLLISLGAMILAIGTVLSHLPEFQEGMRSAFAFSELSILNLIFLWIVIYTVIAIHEVGHGLTCKYFGGEVHEIGVLLLFFQPCLYCNVNDAWLFDKKWKQILVTLAGGYIEFFIGALCCFVWFLTNPSTMIHILAFQVMTVCSVATVLFNFNPLIKLDGYYLLADYLEIPNLRDSSSSYIKYLVSRYIFRMPEDTFEGTKREKRCYFLYGIGSGLWIFFLLTGIFMLVKNLLVESIYELGILVSLFIAYKLFWGQISGAGKFLMKWVMVKREFFLKKKVKIALSTVLAMLLIGLFIPVAYKVPGSCVLEPSFVEILRAKSDGIVREFLKNDGETIFSQQKIVRLENPVLGLQREMADQALKKSKQKFRKSLVEEGQPTLSLKKEIRVKEMEYEQKLETESQLMIHYRSKAGLAGVLSCRDQLGLINKRLLQGDEVCRVLGISKLKAVIEVTEQQIGFIQKGDRVEFIVQSLLFNKFQGVVHRIHSEGVSDPKNPNAKKYNVELLIDNSGHLKPGMTGLAKILADPVTIATLIFRRVTEFLRMDLFV